MEIQESKGWDKLTKVMIDMAQRLEAAGADIVLICTNLLHKFVHEIQREIHAPY
jgi:aspartate racemase